MQGLLINSCIFIEMNKKDFNIFIRKNTKEEYEIEEEMVEETIRYDNYNEILDVIDKPVLKINKNFNVNEFSKNVSILSLYSILFFLFYLI